jgi:hypothetical protein
MDRTQGSPYLGHQTAVSSSPLLGPDRVKHKLGSPLGPYSRPTTPDQSANLSANFSLSRLRQAANQEIPCCIRKNRRKSE